MLILEPNWDVACDLIGEHVTEKTDAHPKSEADQENLASGSRPRSIGGFAPDMVFF